MEFPNFAACLRFQSFAVSASKPEECLEVTLFYAVLRPLGPNVWFNDISEKLILGHIGLKTGTGNLNLTVRKPYEHSFNLWTLINGHIFGPQLWKIHFCQHLILHSWIMFLQKLYLLICFSLLFFRIKKVSKWTCVVQLQAREHHGYSSKIKPNRQSLLT